VTLSDPFDDERIQFFLRNREDIKAWAAIETDVMAATRELLARSQPLIEERLLAVDPEAVVGRHDGGQFERVLARHSQWPATVGLALEWNRTVDPLGRNRPKLGVFWWADPPSLVAPRTRLVQVVDRKPLQELGYRMPLDSVWPVGAFATAKPDWWREPGDWVEGITDLLAATWVLVAPRIDEVLAVEPRVSGG
jgi:hypothetical protein